MLSDGLAMLAVATAAHWHLGSTPARVSLLRHQKQA